jgi:Alginate lyase
VALVFLDDSNPVTGATSTTPATVVASLQEGDHAFIPVSFKRPGSATLATPADWTEIASATVGTGAVGEATGPIGVRVYHRKVPAGGLTLPTLTLGGTTTGSVIQAALIVYRGDLGAASELVYAVTSGSDTSEGTGWSVTGGANIGLAAGDALLCVGAITGPTTTNITTGTVQLIVPGVTPDPLTVATPYNTSAGTGDNVRSFAYRTAVEGGAETAPPQMTATMGSGTGATGGAVFLRLREQAAGSRSAPGAVFDLQDWKWQGPVEDPDDPGDLLEVEQPELNTYFGDYLYLDDTTGRMVLRAPVQGFTNSGATRSEFREMQGGIEASWSPFDTDGVRQLTVTERVDPTSLTDRQEVVVGQIHGALSTPIPLILSAEWESGGAPVTPRIRVFFNGDGVGNLLSGQLTPTTDYTYRIRYDPPDPDGPDPERGGTVSVFAAVGGAENLPASPQFSWRGDQFTDDSGWYLKGGDYNKSEAAAGGSGVAVVEISHFELIQPGDQETRRFYLPNLPSLTPPVSVASWVNDGTGASSQHLLTETPAGAPASFSRAETTNTAPWYVLLGRWVSNPVSVAGTVYGDWHTAAALLADSTTSDLEPLVVVFGTVGLTDERRGTAISSFVGGIDLPTSGASEIVGGPGSGTADMALEVGDRLVVDFGYVARNTTTTPRTGTLHYGGTTPPDLAAGATDYTRPAWIDLTVAPDLEFAEPGATGVLAATAPVPTAALTATTRATGALAATAPLPTAVLVAAIRTPGALAGTIPTPTAALQATARVEGQLVAGALLPAAALAGVVRGSGTLGAQLPGPAAALVADTAVPGVLTAAVPLPAAALAGVAAVAGQLAATAPLPTAHLDVAVAATAVLSGTLPAPTGSLTATTGTAGHLAGSLPVPTAVLTGDSTDVGELAAVLPLPISGLGGDGGARGSLVATAPLPEAVLTATVAAPGELSGMLPLPEADLDGTVATGGATLVAALPIPTADLKSTATTGGALTALVPLPVATLHATTATSGRLDAALPAPVAALAGSVTAAGALAAAIPLPAAALVGDTKDPESRFSAVLPLPTAALTGHLTATGALAAVLPMPTAALVTTPPPNYEGPLRAGRPEWGGLRLRAGLPELAS